jgi:hypothetical protein
MNIPIRDVFLLYGPIDVLVRFDGFKSLNEFVENWFNPVRLIGAEEKLISKTTTYVVVMEGPRFMEKPFCIHVSKRSPTRRRNGATSSSQTSSRYIRRLCLRTMRPNRSGEGKEYRRPRTCSSIYSCAVSGIEEAHTTVVAMTQI